MGRCYNSTVVNAPVEEVWQTVRDFHNADWAGEVVTSIEKVGTINGTSVGARRLLNGVFSETLLELDEAEHTVIYRIDEGPGPLAASAIEIYEGILRLHSVTDSQQTFVEWESRYTTDDDAAVGAFCNPIYQALLSAMKAHFN